jgi:hypothetical protein
MSRLAGIILDSAWEALCHGAEAGCEDCPWLSTSRERYDIGEHVEWQRWIECEAPGPEQCPIVRDGLEAALDLLETPRKENDHVRPD